MRFDAFKLQATFAISLKAVRSNRWQTHPLETGHGLYRSGKWKNKRKNKEKLHVKCSRVINNITSGCFCPAALCLLLLSAVYCAGFHLVSDFTARGEMIIIKQI